MAPFKYTPVQLDDKEILSESDLTFKTRARPRIALHQVLTGLAAMIIIAVSGALVGAKFFRPVLIRPLRDAQAVFPKFATLLRTFEDVDQVKPPPSLWDDILPRGGGFYNIANPRHYGLPQSVPSNPAFAGDDSAEIYGMALWHQLHCVRDIRASLLWYRDGIKPTHAMIDNNHADHCFDYLRQSLECHGDTTVEWGRLMNVDGSVKGSVDGYDIPHQCRDYQAIRDWTVEHRSANETWGDEHPN